MDTAASVLGRKGVPLVPITIKHRDTSTEYRQVQEDMMHQYVEIRYLHAIQENPEHLKELLQRSRES